MRSAVNQVLWLSRRAADRVRTRDPERDALRRALRAAIVVPTAAAISFFAVGGTQAPLFTTIGSIWLLVLVDFPGTRRVRALAYCGLGLNGALLIVLGTVVQPIPWLAVTIMFALGVAVTLAGVLSETIAAGQRATLLTYVWPVCTPPGPVGDRLLGWAIAWAVCVPAALFLLAPRHHGDLRRHAAHVCAALADRLEGVGSAAEVSHAMQALKTNFLSADYRPVGLSAGSRALVRVVDDLEWISERVTTGALVELADMREPAVRVLRCCAHALDAARVSKRTVDRGELDAARAELRSVARGRYRDDIVAVLAEPDDAAAVTRGRELLTRRTIATTVGLTARVIATAAAADARPSWAKALGLRLPPTGAADQLIPETVAAVTTITTGFLTTRSVAARNAVRTGVGLALAVATTHLFPIQHGFWVVLGAIVVLGSSALTTGTKVVRAMVGTAIGVILGAVLIAVVGVEPILLWTLLPIMVFGAAYVPRVASFTAGQAAMTMMVLIVLNLIVPTGWRIGLLRIEDVMAGAAVAVAASLLLWPRGATASVCATIEAAVDVGAAYLQAAVLRVTRGGSEEIDDRVANLSHDALAASRTVDDALRHYLSETGGATDLRAPIVRAANRAIRLRTAGEVIADIPTPPPLSAYPRTRSVLETHAESVAERLKGETDRTWAPVSDEFVIALRAEFTGDEAGVNAALPLVTVAANLGELELIYPAAAPVTPVAR
jgi:Fusaric acid resistance protein-like